MLASLWSDRERRQEVLAHLAAKGIGVEALRGPDADGVDVFDVLMNLAWNQPTRTRSEWARRVRERHHAEGCEVSCGHRRLPLRGGEKHRRSRLRGEACALVRIVGCVDDGGPGRRAPGHG
ncbi:type I restriction-modification enzyme R subunit C-terminal domain-containing protein [Austwickia chelonae]|uniref:type I restriction-modification enzyme R subunit C-terminal domain-containing protein n=1 Tax=Austwickia chelonae TaxID=100225 RepID=UPI003D31CE64